MSTYVSACLVKLEEKRRRRRGEERARRGVITTRLAKTLINSDANAKVTSRLEGEVMLRRKERDRM